MYEGPKSVCEKAEQTLNNCTRGGKKKKSPNQQEQEVNRDMGKFRKGDSALKHIVKALIVHCDLIKREPQSLWV